jgi:hypothetical protein
MEQMTTLTRAAEHFGVHRQTIYAFLRKHNHLDKCERIEADDGKLLMLRIPCSLLDEWTPPAEPSREEAAGLPVLSGELHAGGKGGLTRATS